MCVCMCLYVCVLVFVRACVPIQEALFVTTRAMQLQLGKSFLKRKNKCVSKETY